MPVFVFRRVRGHFNFSAEISAIDRCLSSRRISHRRRVSSRHIPGFSSSFFLNALEHAQVHVPLDADPVGHEAALPLGGRMGQLPVPQGETRPFSGVPPGSGPPGHPGRAGLVPEDHQHVAVEEHRGHLHLQGHRWHLALFGGDNWFQGHVRSSWAPSSARSRNKT